LPFDYNATVEYGIIRADLETQGTPIGSLDTLIAAHAKSLNYILVTNRTWKVYIGNKQIGDFKYQEDDQGRIWASDFSIDDPFQRKGIGSFRKLPFVKSSVK
jgi:hypothetical protein